MNRNSIFESAKSWQSSDLPNRISPVFLNKSFFPPLKKNYALGVLSLFRYSSIALIFILVISSSLSTNVFSIIWETFSSVWVKIHSAFGKNFAISLLTVFFIRCSYLSPLEAANLSISLW